MSSINQIISLFSILLFSVQALHAQADFPEITGKWRVCGHYTLSSRKITFTRGKIYCEKWQCGKTEWWFEDKKASPTDAHNACCISYDDVGCHTPMKPNQVNIAFYTWAQKGKRIKILEFYNHKSHTFKIIHYTGDTLVLKRAIF
ncbi:MAG: hypothetical protein JST26_19735 [Bacteroidetes bacterium]|nr:hypothetical protein [Bacteroidota bacterium]